METLVGCMYHLLHILIIHFLMSKRLDPDFSVQQINEVDIYKFDPFELPGLSENLSDEQVWYFFCEPDYKYAKSRRAKRATASGRGYWKITGQGCDVIDKNRKKIGSKRILVFYIRERGCGRRSKDTKTNWVMHEFYVGDSSRYKKNFVLCCIEKQANNKSSVSTPGDGQPSHNVVEDTSTEVESQQQPSLLISESRNHVDEDTFTEVESQLLSNPNLVSDSRNRFGENTFPTVESLPVPSKNLISDTGNDVTENSVLMVNPQLPSSNYLVSDLRNHVAENISFTAKKSMPDGNFKCQLMVDEELESQLPVHLPSNNSIFGSENHVTENSALMVNRQLPSSGYFVSDSRNHVAENTSFTVGKSMAYGGFECQLLVDKQVESQLLPSNNLISNPEQQSYSSSYSKSSGDANSQWGVQNECPRQGTGQAFLTGTDNETINGMIDELYEDCFLVIN